MVCKVTSTTVLTASTCEVHDANGVRTIMLARPEKLNALTLPMFDLLANALEQASVDSSIRAVLISGAGLHFTAGHDVKEFDKWPQTPRDPVPRAMKALASCPKPVVMAVRGVAMGFGATALLHSDWCVGTADARLRFPFKDLGIGPEAASTLLLSRAVGELRARGLMLRGTEFSGADAHAFGLISEIVPSDDLLRVAQLRAVELAGKGACTVQAIKRCFQPPLEQRLQAIGREVDDINSALQLRRHPLS